MTSSVMEYKKLLEESLNDTSRPWCCMFDYLEEKTKVKRVYIFTGVVAVIGVYLVFGYAAQLLCNTLATAYPAYASLKAIESPQTNDDKKWLTYWTVYALFSIIDYPCDLLLHWFPLYWLAKWILMTWLFVPGYLNGSIIVYNRLIRPKFLLHEESVDSMLSKVGEVIDSAKKNIAKKKE